MCHQGKQRLMLLVAQQPSSLRFELRCLSLSCHCTLDVNSGDQRATPRISIRTQQTQQQPTSRQQHHKAIRSHR